MGINGLLQQLKSISRPTHVSSYRGQKVAIDGYSWLHKGAYSCSRELCEGVWTDGYVRYFVSRVDMLLSNGVVPVVVFDGCRLPMKADEEDSRRRSRREAMERARAHAESGNMAAATECYQRAIDIAPWMARVVMEALRERGVQCLVAPYEADAQMAYLALRGEVHAVLTEDSDLLAYGCPRVLYKLDRAGSGEEVLLADLPLVRELNMAGFSHDMLMQMCILAGCDFLPNMAGVGIKKAHALMRKHRDFVKVVRFLRFNGTSPPPGYELCFQRTIWLFRHQRVFCPAARVLTHLRPLPPGGLGAADVLVAAALPPEGPERQELGFLGPPMPDEVAAGIASGELDPSTLQPFDLAAIYRGCPNPPRRLREVLQLPPLPLSQGAAGGPAASQGGTQRCNSWGPGGGHHMQGYSQGQGHQHQQQNGRHHGKPPVAPGRDPNQGIQRYFKSHPAASQPFRRVVPPGAAAAPGGSQGEVSAPGAAGSGGAAAGARVVTLRGLPVEVVEGGGRSGTEGAGPSGADAGDAAGAEAAESGQELGGECDEAEEGGNPGVKRRRRTLGGIPSASALEVETGGPAPGSSAGGSLFANLRRSTSLPELRRDTEGGPSPSCDGPHTQTQATASRDHGGTEGQVGPLAHRQPLPLGDFGVGGGGSQTDSQGLLPGCSLGARSHAEDGPASLSTQRDSQLDSQLTAGCEAAGLGARGDGRLGGRARGPAQLAIEALFSQPSDSAFPSQQQPCSAGQPSASAGHSGGELPPLGRRQAVSALAALQMHNRRAGMAPAAGQSGGAPSQAAMPTQSQLSPPRLRGWTPELGCGLGKRQSETLGLGCAGAPAERHAAAFAAVTCAATHGSRGTRDPPHFSIYYEDLDDAFGSAAAALGIGDTGGLAGVLRPGVEAQRRPRASGGSGDTEGGSDGEEVTSPLKGASRHSPHLPQRLPGLGLRRRRTAGEQLPRLLHPSARRRLSGDPTPEALRQRPRVGGLGDESADLGLAPGLDLGIGRCSSPTPEDELFAAAGGAADRRGAGVGESGEPCGSGRDGGSDPEEERLMRALERSDAKRRRGTLAARAQQQRLEQAEQPEPDVGAGVAGEGSGDSGGGRRHRRRHLKQRSGLEHSPGGHLEGKGAEDLGLDLHAGRGLRRSAEEPQGEPGDLLFPAQTPRRPAPSAGGLAAEGCGGDSGDLDENPGVPAAADGLRPEAAPLARQEQQQDAHQGDAVGADPDDDEDVTITADLPAAGEPADGAGFHSVRHVEHFAKMARLAVNRISASLQPVPHGKQQPQQRQQRQAAPPRRASVDGRGGAAAAARPLAEFAYDRSAPKRRNSTGRACAAGARGGPAAAAACGYRQSVFVQGDADAGAGQDQEAAPHAGGAAHAGGRGAPASDGFGAGAGLHADGADSDVEIVEAGGPPGVLGGGGGGGGTQPPQPQRGRMGAARQALAERMLRQPFQAPRSIGAAGVKGGAATRAGAGGRTGPNGKEQQPRITDFQRFAFGGK